MIFIKKYQLLSNGITSITFHPILPFLSSSSNDGTVKIWSCPMFEQHDEMRHGHKQKYLKYKHKYLNLLKDQKIR